MKYIVEIKYTNPGHEHVSLRRRVDTVTRMVEASNEQEAINRAANQQRSLGFMIKEAKVLVARTPAPVPTVIAESKKEDAKDKKDMEEKDEEDDDEEDDEEVEQVDEVKAVKAYDKEGKLVGRYRSMDHAKQMKPGHTYKVEEEVELDEGKLAKALAVGAMTLASMGAKAHDDTTKSVAQLAKERPALAQRLQDIGATGQVPASDKRAAELQRKQDQEMPASERRAKELKKEAVDPDKRVAGYKMSPAVRAAQAKSDALSKREKKYQAGTLAAKKAGKVVPQKTDADVKVNVAEETVSERVVNKKVAPDVPTPGQKKKVKAAKIAIGAARSKINLKPVV